MLHKCVNVNACVSTPMSVCIHECIVCTWVYMNSRAHMYMGQSVNVLMKTCRRALYKCKCMCIRMHMYDCEGLSM